MFNYELSQGNPEGADYTLLLKHEKQFTCEEFQDICEASIVETLDKQKNGGRYTSLSCIDTSILRSILESKGFSGVEMCQSYYLEPYWSAGNIKNDGLKKWLNKRENK